jgi:Uma2 family endonuclease
MVQQISKPEIVYPDGDGQPMSDNTLQFSWIVKIKENLEILFADNPQVFVAGDLLWYPVEGDNTIRRAPDAMVAFDRPKGYRGSYRQWEEAEIAPQVVFEVLSPGNRLAEMTAKFEFYDRYGVEEYYIYDPDRVDFTGWVKVAGRLQGISEIAGWVSPRLGIRFELSDELEIYTPTGDLFLSPVEIAKQSQRERERAEQERERADLAEQKLAMMAAKLKELGIDVE